MSQSSGPWPAPTEPPVFGQPPPPNPLPLGSGGRSNRSRPWWGMGDILWMLPIMAVVFVLSIAVIGVLAAAEGMSLSELSDPDTTLPGSMIVIPTLIQQASWFGWPFVVSRWKGLGAAADWGWSFKPVDLGIGLGTAMIALFAAGAVGAATAALVGLEDDAAAENTALLTDLEGSPWLWGVIFLVVIGAPFAEEVLFRGLIMRAVAKRLGTVAGVIASLLTFVPIHFADGGIITDGTPAITDGQIVLWATIAALGLVLAVVTVVTDRLAPAIIAHMGINAVGAVGALGVWDSAGFVPASVPILG